ncbi:MAG: thioredoxin domain-containing protein [Myxococcales bacterium]|nr:thioredoxin domain-containing protein [Myxococcales bacterium]
MALLVCAVVALISFMVGRMSVGTKAPDQKTVNQNTNTNNTNTNNNTDKRPTPRDVPRRRIDFGKLSTPWKGTKDAVITIVEFSDFQCPFCSRVNPAIKEVLSTYKGKVRVEFRHNPLSFHRAAFPAAIAAMAAHKQGKFWEFHDKLFSNRKQWTEDDFVSYAKDLGLDVNRFRRDLKDPAIRAYVQNDQAIAAGVGARGTPNLFVNGVKVVGARPFSYFKTVIDAQLSKIAEKTKAGLTGLKVSAALTRENNAALHRYTFLRQRPSRMVPNRRTPRDTSKVVWRVPVDESKDYIKGPKHAPITIVEFSDFQCPFCSRVNPSIKEVMQKYPGKVRVIFRNFPLPFHKNAALAAEAALAAGAQGKFWEYHDMLFKNQRKLQKDDLISYAKEVGVKDIAKFKDALDKRTYQKKVQEDMLMGQRVGVRGTPNLFVNGRQISGARPFSAFKTIIDEELKKVEKLVSAGTPMSKVYNTLIARGRLAPKPRPYAPSNTVYKVELSETTPCKGSSNALITVVEFSDFECPFCRRALGTLKQIEKDFAGKVRICYVQNPLPFHRHAKSAAIVSLWAKEKGKFWEFHDKLFENNRGLGLEKYKEIAKSLGLDPAELEKAMKDPKYAKIIEADQELAANVGARGTPNFFINGIKIIGARPYAHFKPTLDAQLKKAEELVKKGTSKNKIYAALIKDGKTLPGPHLDDKKHEIPTEGSPHKGDDDAKVVLVEFSDFQCPFCSRVTSVVEELSKAYPKKLKVVFKHMPLSFHKHAKLAAIAAMAAHKQGKFWQFHDVVFRKRNKLEKDDLISYAKDIGLDVEKFKKDLDSEEIRKQVEADMALARKIGVRGTPTFYINGRQFKSPLGYAARNFKKVIDKL